MTHTDDAAREEADADMTPMIDAVFLLIIFFLCIDFRVLEAKLPAYLPKDAGVALRDLEPIEQLSVRVVVTEHGHKHYRNAAGSSTWTDPRTGALREAAYRLEGHAVRWDVGPKTFATLGEFEAELRRIHGDRTTWQPSREVPGEVEPMPIVIEPQAGARYADVATTVDAVTAAGFASVRFGGGMGSDLAPRSR